MNPIYYLDPIKSPMTVATGQAVVVTDMICCCDDPGFEHDDVAGGEMGIVLGESKRYNSTVRVVRLLPPDVRGNVRAEVFEAHDQKLAVLDEKNWQVSQMRGALDLRPRSAVDRLADIETP